MRDKLPEKDNIRNEHCSENDVNDALAILHASRGLMLIL